MKNKKNKIVLVLDQVRSAHNVGSIFRTADAFGVEKIFLVGITPTPENIAVKKTALGAENFVCWEKVEKIEDILFDLKKRGYRLIAVEQGEGAVLLSSFTVEKKASYALIFGHEVVGVSKEGCHNSDVMVEIPQYGMKKSLNVSVATGILLWTFQGAFCS